MLATAAGIGPRCSAPQDLLDELVVVCDDAARIFDCLLRLVHYMIWCIPGICDNDGFLDVDGSRKGDYAEKGEEECQDLHGVERSR
jgi:hypothetical protein